MQNPTHSIEEMEMSRNRKWGLSPQSSTGPWKGREEGGGGGGGGAEVSGGHPLSEQTPPHTPRRRVFCVLLNSDKLGNRFGRGGAAVGRGWGHRGRCGCWGLSSSRAGSWTP